MVVPSPQRISGAHQIDHRVLGDLSDQGPSPPMARQSSLGGCKLLPFKNDGGHCVLGDL